MPGWRNEVCNAEVGRAKAKTDLVQKLLGPQNNKIISQAWMAELVDALDSKSGLFTEVGVRFPLQANKNSRSSDWEFFYYKKYKIHRIETPHSNESLFL